MVDGELLNEINNLDIFPTLLNKNELGMSRSYTSSFLVECSVLTSGLEIQKAIHYVLSCSLPI